MAELIGKILVVDDDEAGRYVKSRLLRGRGYDVREAENGETALERYHRDPPDLVLLDTRLPDISAGELCCRFRATGPRTVVLQTSAAVTGAHDRAEALRSGADAFLIEPIEPEELLATVNALLRMHRAEHDLHKLNLHLEQLVTERTGALAEANRLLAVESAERRKAEQVLWHAQKLEAVGQLTGGIAHDFNNLLAVIVGSTSMVRAHIEGKRRHGRDKLLRLLSAAEEAADRGAKLTRQMLAFARRGVLSVRNVMLDEVLAASENLLRRALGETITLEITSSNDGWPCRIDPAQFEAAILNLAVNARDAMPHGGTFRIRTENVTIGQAGEAEPDSPPPGAYVRVTVEDTGTGMDQEVANRAFEPFFTTKEVGKGTGLGLSQVYGFVKQSGGHILLRSEIGIGSEFRVYLPRSPEALEEFLSEPDAADDVPTGDEMILVVEDNAVVLELATMAISDLGYHVVSAADGAEALDVIRRGDPIALLFSDVVMPGGMNGFELVEHARAVRPDLKVLITTGYTSAIGNDQYLPLPVLHKPYARGDLARRLRQVLDQRPV